MEFYVGKKCRKRRINYKISHSNDNDINCKSNAIRHYPIPKTGCRVHDYNLNNKMSEKTVYNRIKWNARTATMEQVQKNWLETKMKQKVNRAHNHETPNSR